MPKQESLRAKVAFEEYCSLGPSRSLAKLSRINIGDSTVNIRQLERWSSDFGWVERAGQYDAERIEEKRRKQEAEIEAMNQRHALIGTTQQAKAIKQIETLIEAKAFGSVASVQLLKLATDLERLARGVETDRTEMVAAGSIGFYQAVQLPRKTPLKGGDIDVSNDAETSTSTD